MLLLNKYTNFIQITKMLKFVAHKQVFVSSDNPNKLMLDHKPEIQNKTQLKLKSKIFNEP